LIVERSDSREFERFSGKKAASTKHAQKVNLSRLAIRSTAVKHH
jgi:hypothetical protein